MAFNLVIIAILVIGILGVAIASIIILARYADKHPNGQIEVNFKVLGCSFGAKASVNSDSDQEESACNAKAIVPPEPTKKKLFKLSS